MKIELTSVQAEELCRLLDLSLGELSSEIADTDNPGYRVQLKERRAHLEEIRRLLGAE